MQSQRYQNQIQVVSLKMWHKPFFSLKSMLTAPPSSLFNVERVRKLFGIALMAAWYIW